MKKNILLFFIICIISKIFAYEPYNKEYKNLNLNNGIFYNGLVRISPGIKQYSNIWEIKENSITGASEQIIVKCIEKTKVYVNFKETAEDDNTQYIINANCEFIASGKVKDKWIYIKISNEDFRWVSVDKITFVRGSVNDLPELIEQKGFYDGFSDFLFYNNYIRIIAYDGFDGFPKNNTVNEILPYTKNQIDSLNFITFNNRKYLILSNENLLYLYDSNNNLIYYAVSEISSRRIEVFGYKMKDSFSASSELKEKDYIYAATNLDNQNSAKQPWVEAAKDDGIGEYIIINYDEINALIISNGYVDYNKPYLYKNNNRVKVFEVYNQDNKKIQEIELEDTPDPQIFNIVEKCESVKLVIKEVYKGNKWNDTCINFIKIIPNFCSLEGFIYK